MRITKVEPIMLRHTPQKALADGLTAIPSREVLLVKISTDEGIEGIGEGFSLASLKSTAVIVEEILTPLLLGEDPQLIEHLWEKMYRQTFRFGRRGIVMAAISAVDIALWDILGKKANLPVYRLLGGAGDTLIPYASAGYYAEGKTAGDLAEEARGYQQAGFRVMKMKVGAATLKEDMERICTVRERTGDDFMLAVDANNAWDFNTALKMARFCEKMDIFFLEEPLTPDFPEESVRLANATDVPIAGYETQLTSYGMRDFIVRGGVDIVQGDAIWCGGISEFVKLGHLAGVWNKQVIPHFSAGAVSFAANMQVGLALRNASYMEYTLDDNPLRDDLSLYPIRMEQGVVRVPEIPGIGVELNPEVVERFRVVE